MFRNTTRIALHKIVYGVPLFGGCAYPVYNQSQRSDMYTLYVQDLAVDFIYGASIGMLSGNIHLSPSQRILPCAILTTGKVIEYVIKSMNVGN